MKKTQEKLFVKMKNRNKNMLCIYFCFYYTLLVRTASRDFAINHALTFYLS